MTDLAISSVIQAFGLSAVMIFTITFIVFGIIRGFAFRSWDMIREKDLHHSLSRFQFLLWTWVVLFVFLCVVFIRVFADILPIPLDIPSNLLILLGVSAAPPAISSGINQQRYSAAIQRAKDDLIRLGNMDGIRSELKRNGITLQNNAKTAWKRAIDSAAKADQDKSIAEFAMIALNLQLNSPHKQRCYQMFQTSRRKV